MSITLASVAVRVWPDAAAACSQTDPAMAPVRIQLVADPALESVCADDQTHLAAAIPPHRLTCQWLVEWLAQQLARTCPETTLERWRIVAQEALTNALVHGCLEVQSSLKDDGRWDEFDALVAQRAQSEPYCSRQITLCISCSDQGLCTRVHDEGPGFDPDLLEQTTDDPLALHGRGVRVMREYADEVFWSDNGRTTHFRVGLAAPEAAALV